ncbi:ribokinase [Nocardioides sp. NBC_00368]
MSSGRVVVIGSVNCDTSARVSAIPRPGETVLARTLEKSGGGKGANQALAAARAGGAPTTLISRIGDDEEGSLLEKALSNGGVTTQLQIVPATHTGQAFVTVSETGENSIVVVPGANNSALPLNADERAAVAQADVVLLQLETPTDYIRQARHAMRKDGLLILNAAPVVPMTHSEWDAVDVLVVNQHEAQEITGAGEPPLALDILRRRAGDVIMTLGGEGSLHSDHEGNVTRIPPFATKVMDTTGAGDTFCGVLAAHLANGASITVALLNASAAGALSVTKRGAQPSIPTLDEVRALVDSGD